MFITVQFKNRDKVFTGRTYDYLLNKEEEVPKEGSIIRLMDDNYNYINYGTRVKVVKVKIDSDAINPMTVRYVKSSMEEN